MKVQNAIKKYKTQFENEQKMCSSNVISSFETDIVCTKYCEINDDANKHCLPCKVQTNVESGPGRHQDRVKSREQCGVRGRKG